MTTPAPRKRPRVGTGFAGGLNGLISSLIPSPQEQLNTKAKEAADLKDAIAKRARAAGQLFKDYQDGNSTFGTTDAALRAAAAAETDPELKTIIDGYVRDTGTTKTVRDVNAKVDDYNAGRLSFGDLAAALTGVKTDNETVKSGIQKALDGARKAENGRQLQSLSAQYSNGTMDINAYVNAVDKLRNDPTQKDPAELTKLTAAIEGAKQNERGLNDMRVYTQYESGAMTADAALAYFSGRMATATNPTDLANLDKFAGNIRSIIQKEQASGNASVGASLKAAAADANAQLKDYFDNVVKPGVEAAHGDPNLITALYANLGSLASSFVPYVGPEAGYFKEKAQSAVITGRTVAANEVTAAVQARVAALQKSYDAAKADKSLTPNALIARLKSIADEASSLEQGGKYGDWTTPGQKKLGTDMRTEAWTKANALADELMKAKDQAIQDSTQAVSSAFNDAKRALEGKNAAPLKQALMDAGVLDATGKLLDKNKFADWLAANPTENATLLFESANSRKTSTTGGYDSSYDEGLKKYVDAIDKPMTDTAQFTKDARNALVQSTYIQSPSQQGVQVGSADATRADAMGQTSPFKRGAIPLADTRDVATGNGTGQNMLDPGAAKGMTNDQAAVDNRESARGTFKSVTDNPPSNDMSATATTDRWGQQLNGIGAWLKDLFNGAAPAPAPAAPVAQSPDAVARNADFSIGTATPSDYTGPTFSSFTAPDAAARNAETAAANPTPDATPAYDWQIPTVTDAAGTPGGGYAGDTTGITHGH